MTQSSTLPVPSPREAGAPLRLLMVEDSEMDAELILIHLRRHGFEVSETRVTSRNELEAAVQDRSWHIVLSDHNLPGFSGPDALLISKKHLPDVPFIFVSGSIGEEYAVEAMRAGASDLVVKGSLHRLGPAVDRELREAQQHAERRQIAAALADSQNRLREAQKLEAVGRLAGGVAHDFNNLLTAVVGFADLVLADLATDDPHRPDIEEIKDAGKRAVDLTRQLLAFSRGQVLHQSVLKLGQVVDEMARLLKRVLGEHVTLATTVGDDLWLVKCDRTQLDQIIMNLAVNARDAMDSGGTFTLETTNVDIPAIGAGRHPLAPGEYVRLTATDTGGGIAPEVLPHIFEPFFTTKGPGRGTGLGLSTVYGIVRQSGGSIFVDSRIGHGTSFTLYLPRTLELAAPEALAPQVALDSPGHETILLVDDDHSVAELATRILRQQGYQVLPAERPEVAMSLARTWTGQLDVLLTDVVMEGMNGPTLADYVVALHPSVRVVFMSGYTGDLEDELGRHGSGTLLSKPFTPPVLTRRVREALGQPVR